MRDTPFDSQNAAYVQLLYEEYLKNPESVSEDWRRFFGQGPQVVAEAGLLLPDASVPPPDGARAAPTPSAAPPAEAAASLEEVHSLRRLLPLVARATALVQALREHGHQMARLDPLGGEPPGHPQLSPAFFGTTKEELEEIPASIIEPRWGEEPLSHVLTRLEAAYCGSIGYEFEHLEDPARVEWLWEQVESGAFTQPMGADEKKKLLRRLSQVEGLEHFIHRAYLGQKRFSLEGTDMMVPVLDETIQESARHGGREVIIGMAHRGRLNVLAHVVGVSYEGILGGFEDSARAQSALSFPTNGTGDVKYHHGATGVVTLPDGSEIGVSLAPNPSHLEFVNPVVEGMTRARQFEGPGKADRQNLDAVVPVLIHGDAAFAAEGIVAETLNLARLKGYSTGGTIHIIANNQVGFTTEPHEARSTRYSSDLAKGYDVPVVHVNADDPEACLAAARLALAYRFRFHDDFVIDLIGYRRHGHNEGDEPSYTQPLQYQIIDAHPTAQAMWADRLLQEGVIEEGEAAELQNEISTILREAQDRIRQGPEGEEDRVEPSVDLGPGADQGDDPSDASSGDLDASPGRMEGSPTGEGKGDLLQDGVDTRVGRDDLLRLNQESLSYPDGFKVHPKLGRQLQRRKEGFGEDTPLEWAHAETLAFASLLEEGVPIRLTGQDSERGTFSQRHLVLHDVETGEEHVPLEHIGTARFEVYNSPLTETAVVGFEYGYEVGTEPDLVLWEAQFGDFVNVAQVIIDQFLAAGRAKWGQLARLTLLLPHGHEGQGPEHTSARLERFLQLSAEDNMRVVCPTTPAQYFHLIRRQALSPKARPMVVMTPKSLLRHPRASSTLRDLANGGFQPVLDDPAASERRESVTRLVLCTGKLYYDLLATLEKREMNHVAIVRVEELYPFPGDSLGRLVDSYPELQEVIWAQEEPTNMGALSYIGPRLRGVVPRKVSLRPVARPDRASPAEGKSRDHLQAQRRIVEEALGLEGMPE